MAPTTRSLKRRAAEEPAGTPDPSQSATGPEPGTRAETNNDHPDTESEAELDSEPVRKRARRAPKASKRTKVKGKLEAFKNIPVEVFIEIAKYLHPFDLVLLSRVNKFFRELFMTRQAASIWVSARQSVQGLPPCPPELCEPQYAALLFTKMCSQCGKYAPRHMDPALLVRLCANCREEQYKLGPTLASKITDRTLVAVSSERPPRNLRYWGTLHLSSDVEAVESKLKELKSAGDKDALQLWQDERRKTLKARYENIPIFTSWFALRDSEREDDLNQRKDAHEAEVQTRLISLGWDQIDHLPYDNPRRKKWISLVRTAKVLTDRAWDKLFPQLEAHLKLNRQERLDRERSARRRDRQEEIHKFWNKAKDGPPLLQIVSQREDIDAAPATKSKENILYPAFPTFGQLRDWPDYQQLMDDDIPGAELGLRLQGKQDSLNEYIQKWRTQLEETLIKQLPDHTEPPNFDSPTLTLSSNGQSPSNIFPGIQMLLRADVAFKRGYSSIAFYPEDFQDTFYDSTQVHYNAESSGIAKDLLRTLGKSGATYLEMKSLGAGFQCGRCNGPLQRMSWKSIIQHYIIRKAEWERQSRFSAEGVVFVFTHDLQVENPNKPLVRIINENEDPVAPAYGPRKRCFVCKGVGLYESILEPYIKDHLRDVHLIEEPEEGKHFGEY